MPLRLRVLFLWVGLSLVPMLLVGAVLGVLAYRSAADVVDARLAADVERAALAVYARYDSLAQDLARAGRALLEGDRAGAAAIREGAGFRAVEVRSGSRTLARLGPAGSPADGAACPVADGPLVVEVRIAGGTAVGRVAPDRLLAFRPLGGGQLVVLDRATGRPLHDPACLVAASGLGVLATAAAASRGTTRIVMDGESVPAQFVALDRPAWMLVYGGGPAAQPVFGLGHLGVTWLILFLAVAASGAALVLIGNFVASLRSVASAAERIGQGDFSPWLPPPGTDEIGRLSRALGETAARLEGLMHQNVLSRQMAALGEMASHIAHEIRNPLSSIRVNLQSLEREVSSGAVPSDLPAVLRSCLRDVSRLGDVVQGVLRLSRHRAPEREGVRVADLVDEALAGLAARADERCIAVHTRIDADAIVFVDPTQIRGVVRNLIENALDALAESGTIRVWSAADGADDGRGVVRLHVADDGAGVPPNLRDRIFEPFFSTKPLGSGIGLAVARRAVEAHGGRIFLEKRSELERGAEFVIELPGTVPPAGEDRGRGRAAAPAWRDARARALRRPRETAA